jgi:hypothetical protein
VPRGQPAGPYAGRHNPLLAGNGVVPRGQLIGLDPSLYNALRQLAGIGAALLGHQTGCNIASHQGCTLFPGPANAALRGGPANLGAGTLHNMNSGWGDGPGTFAVGESSRAGARRRATQVAAWFSRPPNMARATTLAGNQRRTAVPIAESSSAGATRGTARVPTTWEDLARARNMERINAQYVRARAEALAGNHQSILYLYHHPYMSSSIFKINQLCFHFYTANRRRLGDGGNNPGGGNNTQPGAI